MTEEGYVITMDELYILVWSGGYEAPAYTVETTKEAAIAQALEWWKEADEESDSIDVLRLDLTTNLIERIEVEYPE